MDSFQTIAGERSYSIIVTPALVGTILYVPIRPPFIDEAIDRQTETSPQYIRFDKRKELMTLREARLSSRFSSVAQMSCYQRQKPSVKSHSQYKHKQKHTNQRRMKQMSRCRTSSLVLLLLVVRTTSIDILGVFCQSPVPLVWHCCH